LEIPRNVHQADQNRHFNERADNRGKGRPGIDAEDCDGDSDGRFDIVAGRGKTFSSRAAPDFRFKGYDLAALLFGHEKGFEPFPVPGNRAILHPFTNGEDQHSPEQILIAQTVMGPFTLFSVFNEASLFQGAEVKGHFRLHHVQRRYDVANA
jgi:hypothetical protein